MKSFIQSEIVFSDSHIVRLTYQFRQVLIVQQFWYMYSIISDTFLF